MEEVKPKNIFETPQGDERLGWTGDAEIFCRTACFLENTYSFYRKWLRDVEADQTEEGGVAHVVPDIISGQYLYLLIFALYSAKIFFIIFRKEILLYEIQEGIEQ